MANRELAAPLAKPAWRANLKTDVLLIAAFVALMTICSWIRIPGPVPVTLQTFAVFLTVAILGTRRGTIAVVSYIVIGLAGAPVFAGMIGGPAYLLGLTGGYIIGFVGTALVTGSLIDRFGKSVPVLAASMIAGLLVCYAFGTAWVMAVSGAGLDAAGLQNTLSLCVTPFIVPDAIKIALAIAIVKTVGAVKAARSN